MTLEERLQQLIGQQAFTIAALQVEIEKLKISEQLRTTLKEDTQPIEIKE